MASVELSKILEENAIDYKQLVMFIEQSPNDTFEGLKSLLTNERRALEVCTKRLTRPW